MNNKTQKILIATFITLGVIAAFPWIEKELRKDETPAKKEVSVNLAAFTKDKTNSITIKKGDEEKQLSLKNDQWILNDQEIDQATVENLFDDFSDLEVKQVASQNEENHQKFEVDEKTAIILTINQSGKDSKYFIGKAGTIPNEFYMRKDGIKTVYLVSGLLRDKLTWDSEKWKKEQQEEENKESQI